MKNEQEEFEIDEKSLNDPIEIEEIQSKSYNHLVQNEEQSL